MSAPRGGRGAWRRHVELGGTTIHQTEAELKRCAGQESAM